MLRSESFVDVIVFLAFHLEYSTVNSPRLTEVKYYDSVVPNLQPNSYCVPPVLAT